jgi:hypothetical protein
MVTDSYELVSFDPMSQSWRSDEGFVLDSIQSTPCLVKVGTLLRIDNIQIDAPVRKSLEHTANFVASYAVGVNEYTLFVKSVMPLLRRSRLLAAIGPLRGHDKTTAEASGIHLLKRGGDFWLLHCLPSFPSTFVARENIVEEGIEARMLLECFTHFSYDKSTRRFAVEATSLSTNGTIEGFRVHTNSAMAAGTADWPFGIHNLGPSWIQQFCMNHKCSEFCQHLRLPPCRFV